MSLSGFLFEDEPNKASMYTETGEERETKVTINNAAASLSALVIKQTIHAFWMHCQIQLVFHFADYFKNEKMSYGKYVFI